MWHAARCVVCVGARVCRVCHTHGVHTHSSASANGRVRLHCYGNELHGKCARQC